MPIVTRCLPNAHAFACLGDFEREGTVYGHFRCEICGWEEYETRTEEDE